MGTIHIFIFSGNASFVGDRLNSLGGDKACADIDLKQCILSLMHNAGISGMNVLVCALNEIFRDWESKQPRQNG